MKKVVPIVLLVCAVLIIVLVNYAGLLFIPESPWLNADEIEVFTISNHTLTERADGDFEINTYMPDPTDSEPRPDIGDENGHVVITVDLGFRILPEEATLNSERYKDNGDINPAIIVVVTDSSHFNIPEFIDSGIADNPATAEDESLTKNPDYLKEYYRCGEDEIFAAHAYVKIMATGRYTVRVSVNETNSNPKTSRFIYLRVWTKDQYMARYGEGG